MAGKVYMKLTGDEALMLAGAALCAAASLIDPAAASNPANRPELRARAGELLVAGHANTWELKALADRLTDRSTRV